MGSKERREAVDDIELLFAASATGVLLEICSCCENALEAVAAFRVAA